MQDRFRVVGVRDVAADSKDITTFFYVVLEVVVGTLVSELRHFDLFRCKLFVEIVQVQAGRGKVLYAWKKDCGLQLGHRSFKLGRNERERFVLYAKRSVKIDGLRDEVGVELVQVVVKQRRKVFGQVVTLLKAGT